MIFSIFVSCLKHTEVLNFYEKYLISFLICKILNYRHKCQLKVTDLWELEISLSVEIVRCCREEKNYEKAHSKNLNWISTETNTEWIKSKTESKTKSVESKHYLYHHKIQQQRGFHDQDVCPMTSHHFQLSRCI